MHIANDANMKIVVEKKRDDHNHSIKKKAAETSRRKRNHALSQKSQHNQTVTANDCNGSSLGHHVSTTGTFQTPTFFQNVSTKSIRQWGCDRTDTPFIFVHVGKSTNNFHCKLPAFPTNPSIAHRQSRWRLC